MKLQTLHNWDLEAPDAISLQKQLASQLRDEPAPALDQIRYIGGVDVSVKAGRSQAAVVILSYPDLSVVEIARAERATDYPYIPGLLSFREGPVLLDAFDRLQQVPDVFIFDGMGRIHPRRMGIAAHMGLWLDLPTIGCGKTHFLGEYDPPGMESGDYTLLTYKGGTLGAVLRTRSRVKPVYISAGHRMDLTSAIQLTMACVTRYRLPEPIRQAHQAAGSFGD